MVLVDAGIDDADAHARAGVGAAADRAPRRRHAHQVDGRVEQGSRRRLILNPLHTGDILERGGVLGRDAHENGVDQNLRRGADGHFAGSQFRQHAALRSADFL